MKLIILKKNRLKKRSRIMNQDFKKEKNARENKVEVDR